jgi:hypothetical protein
MGRAYSTYGSEEKHVKSFSMKPEGKKPVGRLHVDGRI